MMKSALKAFAAGLMLVLIVSCSGQKDDGAQGSAVGENIAGVVNGESISMVQVDRVVAQWRQAGQAPVDLSLPITELRKSAFDQLVDRILIYQEGVRKGYTADSAQVAYRMQQFTSQFPTQEQQEMALRPMGVDAAGLEAIFKQDLVIQNFIQREVAPTVDVSEEACQKYYDANPTQFQSSEQVHARHILFMADENATPEQEAEARTKAQQIRERAIQGEDFAELAKENSEGPSAPRGGDLGFFERGRMVPPFEAAAFALQPGEISDLVRTQFGFHIIKVEERKEAGAVPYSTAAPTIRGVIQQQGVNAHLQGLVQQLRQDADIQTNL